MTKEAKITPKERIQASITIFKDRMAAAKEDLRKKVQTFFKEMTDEFFKLHPEIKSFSWDQHTDYYDDCDTYPFKAHINYPSVTFTDGNDKDHSRTQCVKEFLASFEEPTYEILFGGDVLVTVTKDGSTTEESEGY